MVWWASDWGPSCLPNIMGCWRIWNRTPPLCWKSSGEKTPRFEALLEVLEHKMQQYRSKRAARSEFKAVKQMENESLKDYFRRVRYLGDLALSKKITHRKRSGFTWPVFGWTIRLPVATKTLWRRNRPQFLRSIIQGPRTRALPEELWRKTQTTAVAFLGCEIDQSRISRSLWEKGAIAMTVRLKIVLITLNYCNHSPLQYLFAP